MLPTGGAERGTWRGAGFSGAGQARRAEETSTPQEDVDALRGPERRRLQKRTDVAIPHSPCDMPDDGVETCDGVRVWELPC